MKKGYTIREVAELIGISTDAIRLYEKEGLVSPLRDPNNGYRYYGPSEIQRIIGIYLHRQVDAGISEIRELHTAKDLPEISTYFSKLIQHTESELSRLQLKLDQLQFMKKHIEHLHTHLGACTIQELPITYMLFQQDFTKTLYQNTKDVITSPVFSFGNFCYSLRTNATGTYSPHALEFAIREPMMLVCPWNDKVETFRKINACRCIYSVITAPILGKMEWDLSHLYAYAKEKHLTCAPEGYAFYVYSLFPDDTITDFYEIYLPILE